MEGHRRNGVCSASLHHDNVAARRRRADALSPARERAVMAAVQMMARNDAWLALQARSLGGRWRLLARRKGGGVMRLGEVEHETVRSMRDLGLLEEEDARKECLRLSPAGRRWLSARVPACGVARDAAGPDDETASCGPGAVAPASCVPLRPPPAGRRDKRLLRDPEDGRLRQVDVNTRENPLLWLARRKDARGRPLLHPRHVAAGERLRADYDAACMQPGLTTNWDAALAARDRSRLRGGPRDPFPMAERVIAARERVWRALCVLPDEQANIALRICCLAEGLEAAERTLGWPRRSARLILRMALEQLATHYGIPREGESRAAGAAWRRMLSWHAPDGHPWRLMPDEEEEGARRDTPMHGSERTKERGGG